MVRVIVFSDYVFSTIVFCLYFWGDNWVLGVFFSLVGLKPFGYVLFCWIVFRWFGDVVYFSSLSQTSYRSVVLGKWNLFIRMWFGYIHKLECGDVLPQCKHKFPWWEYHIHGNDPTNQHLDALRNEFKEHRAQQGENVNAEPKWGAFPFDELLDWKLDRK